MFTLLFYDVNDYKYLNSYQSKTIMFTLLFTAAALNATAIITKAAISYAVNKTIDAVRGKKE